MLVRVCACGMYSHYRSIYMKCNWKRVKRDNLLAGVVIYWSVFIGIYADDLLKLLKPYKKSIVVNRIR